MCSYIFLLISINVAIRWLPSAPHCPVPPQLHADHGRLLHPPVVVAHRLASHHHVTLRHVTVRDSLAEGLETYRRPTAHTLSWFGGGGCSNNGGCGRGFCSSTCGCGCSGGGGCCCKYGCTFCCCWSRCAIVPGGANYNLHGILHKTLCLLKNWPWFQKWKSTLFTATDLLSFVDAGAAVVADVLEGGVSVVTGGESVVMIRINSIIQR